VRTADPSADGPRSAAIFATVELPSAGGHIVSQPPGWHFIQGIRWWVAFGTRCSKDGMSCVSVSEKWKQRIRGSLGHDGRRVTHTHTHTHMERQNDACRPLDRRWMRYIYHDCCCCCCCRLDCDVVTSLRSRRVKPLRVWCSTPRDNVISRYLYDYYVHTSVHVKTCVSSRSRLLESSVIASFHQDSLNGLGPDRIF